MHLPRGNCITLGDARQRPVNRSRLCVGVSGGVSLLQSVRRPEGDELDPTRATPAVINDDSINYVPTNHLVLFGHHFAAIAGAGPLVGPVLAAQIGLPARHAVGCWRG
ncbi:carbon starvation CstA family protein [Shigella flexneri]